MEFKGTNKEWHALEFAGFYLILDDNFYESNNLFDSEQVGEEVALHNARLASYAPEMLKMLNDMKGYLGSDKRQEVEELIKIATTV